MKRTLILIAAFVFYGNAKAQRITPDEYINTYKEIAILEMKRVGIPASITLAQGILETESGNSDLVRRSNNHFGIKCKSTWTGESVKHTDDAIDECFRKYPKAEDSYKDHSNYLRATPRYASLFELAPSDYKGWAYGLKKAGYATNPRYPQILISNIEKYNLLQFDAPGDSLAVVIIAPAEPEIKIAPVFVPAVPAITPASITINTNSRFNGLKAYFAAKGTSLLAIATAADIPLTKLLEFNDLATDGLLKESCPIYLEKKSKQGNRDTYTSMQDESLYEISQNNGVQLKALAELNNLPETAAVKKGSKIKLRAAQSLTISK